MNMFSVHGLLLLGCLPENLMMSTILVPWWSCNQVACDSNWCKTDLEHILLCSLPYAIQLFLSQLPYGFTVISSPRAMWHFDSLHCQQWGGTVSDFVPWMWLRGNCSGALQDGESSAPPWGSAACQTGDLCTLVWWREGQRDAISSHASASTLLWLWPLRHGYLLATGDKWGSVRERRETVSPPTTHPQTSAPHCPKGTGHADTEQKQLKLCCPSFPPSREWQQGRQIQSFQ